jgi:hypothetical protein
MKATVVIQDLPMNKALDREAMAAVYGGNGMASPTTNVTNSSLSSPTGNGPTSVGHTIGTTNAGIFIYDRITSLLDTLPVLNVEYEQQISGDGHLIVF